MLAHLRYIQLLPATQPCLSLSCLERVLSEPVVTRLPVVDAAGTEYAFDLAPTQGTLVILIGFVLYRWVVDAARRIDE